MYIYRAPLLTRARSALQSKFARKINNKQSYIQKYTQNIITQGKNNCSGGRAEPPATATATDKQSNIFTKRPL